jgi:ribonuclease P protein component
VVHGALGSASGRHLLRLLPTDRLRKRFEFGRVRDQGRRVYTQSFVLQVCPNPEGAQRLGLTVSVKVGNAVRRNRVKRLVREVFRTERALFPGGSDIVVIVKAGCRVDSYGEVHSELRQARAALAHASARAALAAPGPAAEVSRVRGPTRLDPRSKR